MIDPLHFLIGFLYGSVTLAAWSVVLWRALIAVPRSKARILTAVATELVALAFGAMLILSVLLNVGEAGRWLLVGIGMGAFTGAGVLAVFDR